MIRLSIAALQLSELFVSSLVHMLYGFYIFSTAVAGDLSQALNEWVYKPNSSDMNVAAKEEEEELICSTTAHHLPPIVLVHGIFGFGKGRLGGLSYFAGAEKKDERVLVPDLGSLTSIYDRARELFYYLKGGQVDYGEEHSKACGHPQFGRIYEKGHYPEWDADHPIHFVGHSAGAQVVRVLQQMLADKGHENTSEYWVLSLTSLSGAFNGTTRFYLDGMQCCWIMLNVICKIYEVEGIVMAIPMHGHPVPSYEENSVLQDCRRLHDLIDSHDAVFLLTNTRESRWLLTLLCASANKITITAALGFDSFLVMHHGADPLSAKHELRVESVNALSPELRNFSLKEGDGRQRLGCYFCSDVVAPIDSTANRTLDQ